MKILIVEDDEDKAGKVAEEVRAVMPGVELLRAKSFDGALRTLVAHNNEIGGVLLDMSMPNFDDFQEPPENFAGRDLLRQCKLRNISKPTIVITQLDLFGVAPNQISLDELHEQLSSEFGALHLGTVYYSSVHESWKEQLSQLMQGMKNLK